MKQSEHIKLLLTILDENYPKEVICYLNHTTPFELLIATILSAQCTDDRVNLVTPNLFRQFKDVHAFASANIADLENAIKSTGFYKNKAKNISMCSKQLISEFNGTVPEDIDKLTSLAGVGRKTANVIRGNIFKIPSIVVDTHVKRISIRWGITKHTDPVHIEYELANKLPKEHWIRYNTQVIAHGREICTARSPKCSRCMFLKACPHGLTTTLAGLPSEVIDVLNSGNMY